jgi:hypothetical protein
MNNKPGVKMFTTSRAVIFACLLISASLFAQSEASDSVAVKSGWHNKLNAGLNLNQAAFDNWSRGGENSLAWQILIDGDFDYYQPMWNLDMLFKINYGRSKIGSQDDRKTNDELRFDAVYNYHSGIRSSRMPRLAFSRKWMMASSIQTDTSSTKISGAFDPAYLTLAARPWL